MTQEDTEKIRQAIMRYQELMELLQQRFASGKKRYEALFSAIPAEQRATLHEKALQREAAVIALEDLEPLRRTVLQMMLGMRDLHREFEELYNNIAPDSTTGSN